MRKRADNFFEKRRKKVLTKVKLFGNLTKLSAAASAAAVSTKKNLKKFKKVLDRLIKI